MYYKQVYVCVCISGRTKKQWWSLISHVGVTCSRLKEYVCVCVCVCDARLEEMVSCCGLELIRI